MHLLISNNDIDCRANQINFICVERPIITTKIIKCGQAKINKTIQAKLQNLEKLFVERKPQEFQRTIKSNETKCNFFVCYVKNDLRRFKRFYVGKKIS